MGSRKRGTPMSGHPILPAERITLPLLPLRDVVVFPHRVIPLFVGGPKSIKALEAAMEAGRQIMLVAEKAAGKDEPKPDDMFEVGCVSSILQVLKLHDGTVTVLVEGIPGSVKRQMEKSQREYYLNEQVKAIQKELGDGEEGADMEELEKKIAAAKMPKEARKKVDAELKKLKLMSPMSAEATVVRNYIDTLVNLPWSKKTKIKHDLGHAEIVLNEDHYGLDKVKDCILEYPAVQQGVDKMKSPILCLVRPPGVGKTSLGQSIAKATGRKYVRMALG